MITNDNKCLLQIPKTGTMTMLYLGNSNRANKNYKIHGGRFDKIHMRYDQGIENGTINTDMELYIVSRNIYYKLCSAFLFRKVNRFTFKYPKRVERIKNMFKNFVMNNLERLYNESMEFDKHNKMMNYFLRPMTAYCKGCPKEKLHIIPLDDKEKFISGLEKFFEIKIDPTKLPRKHKSLGLSNYMDFYTPEMIEIVNKLYKDDFEFFGFEMK